MHSSNWDDLRHFVAAARHGSFAAAGRELGVEHTTVARRVAALEERLNAKLFDRARDGLRLTSAGDQVLARASEIQERVQSVERLAGTFRDEDAGEVVLSSGTVLAESFVFPGLPRLRARHPSLSLRLQLGRRLVSLQHREADVGLRMRPAGLRVAEDDVVVTKLGEAEFALYASRAYLKARPAFSEQPERHRRVSYGNPPWEPGGARMSEFPDLPTELWCDDMTMVRRACLDGVGLAVLPAFYAERVKLTPVLRNVDSAVLSLVVHPDLRRVRRVRAVLDWLRSEVKSRLKAISSAC